MKDHSQKTAATHLFAGLLLVLWSSVPALAQEVSGVVTDAQTRESLPGVNIAVKGTTTGTTTAGDGRYQLTVPSLEESVLQFSFVGYETVDVPVEGRTSIDVQLIQAVYEGEEMVVIGYGMVRKSDLTGSVTSISPETVTQIPTTNVMEALQGKVPGMDITRTSGESGSGVSVTIRGNRSLTASNNPLVIVDGIQYGSMQDINPEDVASIEVLRDASSTAIYGSRGANGVILITTKRGAEGRTQVTFNSYTGISDVPNYPHINTGAEYVALRREANRTTGTWSSPEDDHLIFSGPEMEALSNGHSTDFRDLLFRRGFQQDYQLGVSTTIDNTNVYLSLNYFDERGIFELDNLQRYTGRLNVEQRMSDVLKVGMNSQITFYDRSQRREPLNMANKITPLTRAFDDDGDLVVFPNAGRDISPLADTEPNAYDNNTLTTRIFPTAFVEFSPVQRLTFRSNLGANLVYGRHGIYRDSNTIDRAGSAPQAIYTANNSRNVTFDNILNYDTSVDQHNISLTGVFSYQFSQSDFISGQGENQLLASQLYFGLLNAPDGVVVESGYVGSSLMSYAGRVNWGFRDRYLVTLTGRFDGSSKLNPDNRWAFFPSIAGAWRIIEEGFMGDQRLFSDLKLRASYGVSGNDAISPYSTQTELRRLPYSFGESAAFGFALSPRLGNIDLEWELSSTVNFGLDVGLWNNRVYATADVYQTNTTNLLLDRFLPSTSGVSSVTQNVGATRNRGVELAVRTNNIVTTDVLWRTNLTFFSNQEEIVELVGGADDIANGWFIGHPTAVFYDYENIGIWQEWEREQAARYGQEPGDIKIRDQNDSGEITSMDDRIILGSPRPRWSGGLENSVRYRNLDLNVYLYARIGQMMNYEYYQSYKPDGIENGARVNYWTPENPSNEFPRPNAQRARSNYPYYSTLGYADGSFVKVRSATVGYTLPQSLSERFSVNRLRLYVTGRNLLTLTGVDNYDPERGGALSFPMTRLFITGVNVNF